MWLAFSGCDHGVKEGAQDGHSKFDQEEGLDAERRALPEESDHEGHYEGEHEEGSEVAQQPDQLFAGHIQQQIAAPFQIIISLIWPLGKETVFKKLTLVTAGLGEGGKVKQVFEIDERREVLSCTMRTGITYEHFIDLDPADLGHTLEHVSDVARKFRTACRPPRCGEAHKRGHGFGRSSA